MLGRADGSEKTASCHENQIENINYKNKNEEDDTLERRRQRRKAQRIRVVQVTTDDDQSLDRKSNEPELVREGYINQKNEKLGREQFLAGSHGDCLSRESRNVSQPVLPACDRQPKMKKKRTKARVGS